MSYNIDYDKAASYWIEKEAKMVHMDEGALLAEMEKFILAHNTCALSTGCGDFVRCTPVEYNYIDRKFWLFSEGGLKFRGLKDNKNVCLAIYDSYTGFNCLAGMQISGMAELIEPWSEEYMELLAFKKITPDSLKSLPQTLYLIKIRPARIDFLKSEYKKWGFDSRQYITF